jgi:antitoxin component YwqK of YwqJK toxin-antitoxin module
MNASVNYTNQNYSFAFIAVFKMKIRDLFIIGTLLLATEGAYAQVKPDTLPAFMADSIKTVYIYADTGTALNRIDQKGRKQGLWEKKYPDGHLRYRGHFTNNNPRGVFKNYYDEGDSLESLRVYSDDGKSAYAHLFYTTGALQAEGKYVNEKRDSIWKFYNDLQRLIQKDQYKNGRRNGKSVKFYPEDGNVLEVKNWVNDSEQGPFQQYYDEGGIMVEGAYVHGKMEGLFYIYDIDGKVAIKGNYVNDRHEGNWVYFHEGKPNDTLIYRRGNCLNCYKFNPSQKQEDSLKLHYQYLQEQLEHPSNDLENGTEMPGREE